MYYNFYSEAKNDIETTRSWLDGLLLRSANVAILAYDYTPAAEAGLINTKYELACNEINSTRHEKTDHYCFVAKAELVINHMFIYNGEFVKKYGEADPANINVQHMGAEDILLLKRRYERLKEIGITESSDFATYLVDLKLVDKKYKNDPVITGNVWSGNYPTDNTITAKISSRNPYSSWYKGGDSVKIGNWGKLTAEYFEPEKVIKADFVEMDGTVTTNCYLDGNANYHEDHWYWHILTAATPPETYSMYFGESLYSFNYFVLK
jgi:hypothetical protein